MRPTREELRIATENLGKRFDLELMLDVIRAESDTVAAAVFETWLMHYPVDDMDVHAMKLVPRLVERMNKTVGPYKEQKRLCGIARYLWTAGEVMMEGARDASEFLQREEIVTVAIKGTGLRQKKVVDPMLRPMLDADLALARKSDYLSAMRVLQKRGWSVKTEEPHATTLVRGHAKLDLHQVPVRIDPRFSVNSYMLGGVALSQHDPKFRVLDDAGEFIVTILHGMRLGSGALWVLDAEAQVARVGDAAHFWDYIVAYAVRRALVLVFDAALARLRLPLHVYETFHGLSATHIEALELRHVTTAFERHGAVAARLLTDLRGGTELVRDTNSLDGPATRWDPRWVREWR